MRKSQIKRILFAQSIHPLHKARKIKKPLIFGFDSEFTSKSPHRLLLASVSRDGVCMLSNELSWEGLKNIINSILFDDSTEKRLSNGKTAFLSCFWSTAELQHLNCTDKHVLFREWRSGAYDATFKVNARTTIKVVDLAHWFSHQSMKTALATFGIKKLEYGDMSKITKRDLQDARFHRYAAAGAHEAEALMIRLRDLILKNFDVDLLVYRTPASASMAAFRQKYVKENFSNSNLRIRTLVLRASHGGANQAYFRGSMYGNFRLYDAPSQFPQCVVSLKQLPNSQHWVPARDLSECKKAIDGVAEVEFSFPAGFRYPNLPVEKDRLYYPRSGNSFCTLSELRLAVGSGADVKIKKLFVFYEGSNILARYMKTLIEKKNEAERNGQSDLRYLYKLMANSIIGKFTQKSEYVPINRIVARARELEMSTGEYTSILGQMETDTANHRIKREINLGSGYYPEWYALILGKSRASIFRAAAATKALVISTDSFICDDLPECVYEPWRSFLGIRYDLRGRGDRFICYREKFYALMQGEDFIHKAHHGNYGGPETLEALREFTEGTLKYKHKKITTLREGLTKGIPLGKTRQVETKHDLDYGTGHGVPEKSGLIFPLEK